MSNLRLIKEQSATSVSSMSITDCFSSDFDIYQVVLTNFAHSDGDCFFRFINSSGSVVATGYDDAVLLQRSYGSFGENYGQNLTEMGSISYDNEQKGSSASMWIFNPYNSDRLTQAMFMNASASTTGTPVRTGYGWYKTLASISGINFLPNSGTISAISVAVYGLRVD